MKTPTFEPFVRCTHDWTNPKNSALHFSVEFINIEIDISVYTRKNEMDEEGFATLSTSDIFVIN